LVSPRSEGDGRAEGTGLPERAGMAARGAMPHGLVPFDLALVDVNMPAMDGISFVRLLRSLPETRRIPVLMVTVDDSSWVRMAATEAGASGVVSKPIDRLELTAQSREAIANAA